MIAGLLAIWKTGNAYVPVDPELPNERIAFILEDCGANVLLTSSIYQSRFSEITRCSILNLDEPMMAGGTDNTTIPVTHQDVAYIIYTSGTTGKPKGVMVDHDSLVNRILWAQDYFRLQADDRVLQKTNFTFDVSVWEFFWPLVSGASLALAKPGKHADPQYLHEAIDRYGITTIHFVPPMLPSFALAAKSSTSSLRRILCSGQSLLSAQIKKIREAMPAVALFNLYGPTEATIDVTVYSVTGDETLVPIGKPVANTQLYVLDREMKIVPTGVIGELYIAGTQVARGYLNHPELSE
ncbi:MAG: AMP-binding protein, partial [Pseudomonadales bacterium]